ncbi:MAG: hypothetical protein IT372_30030 [Polyangiaceae bacterium]|nr:hypothetical protein [Polyangiaceae bacterium]
MSAQFSVFARYCARPHEIVIEMGAPQVLVDVYEKTAGQPFQAFTDSMASVKAATERVKAAEKGKTSKLAEMDKLFRTGRSAVAAVVPGTVLPDTLKVQPTDTDRRNAIQELVSTVQKHAGEGWADNLMSGEFGQKAPAALETLNEYIAAANALQKAKADRLTAFEPAWGAFVKFRRLVRDTLGSSSRQYRGLRPRGAGKSEDAGEEAGDAGEEAKDAGAAAGAAKADAGKATTKAEGAKPEANAGPARPEAKADAPKPAGSADTTAAPESAAVPSVH